jgi:K+-sensing histidine kinase KdpD
MVCARSLQVNTATVGFLYLLLVLAVATVWGLTQSVISSVVAMLCYNCFFLPPVGQFTIADPENLIALLTFLVTALVASHLSERAMVKNLEARRRQKETEQLYALSRAILLTDSGLPIGAQAARHIAQVFGAEAVALFDAETGLSFLSGAAELPAKEPILKQLVPQRTPEGVHERILIHITEAPKTAALIRRGRRVADYLKAGCFAVCVPPEAGDASLSAKRREAIDPHLDFARKLHIETHVLEGGDEGDSVGQGYSGDRDRRPAETRWLAARPDYALSQRSNQAKASFCIVASNLCRPSWKFAWYLPAAPAFL